MSSRQKQLPSPPTSTHPLQQSASKLDNLMESITFDDYETSQAPSVAPAAVFRTSRNIAETAGSAARRSKSSARLEKEPEEDSSLTLGELLNQQATMSGNLEIVSEETLKRRFFVLQDDNQTPKLHLFRTNTEKDSFPVSTLALLLVTPYFDDTTSTWTLKLHGSSASGSKRSWLLRCPDESTMVLWARSISRLLASRVSQDSSVSTGSSGGGSSPITPGFPSIVRSPSAASVISPVTSFRKNSVTKQQPHALSATSAAMSTTATRGVPSEERQAEMRRQHEEYVATQQQIGEQRRKELQAQREKEAREKLQREERERYIEQRKAQERARMEVELQRAQALLEAKQAEKIKQSLGIGGML